MVDNLHHKGAQYGVWTKGWEPKQVAPTPSCNFRCWKLLNDGQESKTWVAIWVQFCTQVFFAITEQLLTLKVVRPWNKKNKIATLTWFWTWVTTQLFVHHYQTTFHMKSCLAMACHKKCYSAGLKLDLCSNILFYFGHRWGTLATKNSLVMAKKQEKMLERRVWFWTQVTTWVFSPLSLNYFHVENSLAMAKKPKPKH